MRNIMVMILLCIFTVGCALEERPEQATGGDTYPKPITETIKEIIPVKPAQPETPIDIVQDNADEILVNPDGLTVKERFIVPEGFTRIEGEAGGFAEFLQSLKLKADGTKVKYFDGREKTRDVYMAVVDYTLGDRDLQQCADAVMRLRAEYLYSINQADKIKFNFVNGFTAEFSKWSEGYGVSVKGNDVSWIRNSNNNNSYESFQKYLNIVYAYSSTLSLEKELIEKDINDLETGDVFIEGGSPGHCVIVVDTALSEQTGEKIFMLAQSYMPAQDIQILKGQKEGSPWYTVTDFEKLFTPEWVFDMPSLRTWNYTNSI